MFVLTTLVSFYYGSLYLRSDPDNIRGILAFGISEFAVLAGVQFLLYTAEDVAPDYFAGSLCFKHVGGGMFFRFPTSVWNVRSHFLFYKVAVWMCMDLNAVTLAFHVVSRLIGPRLLAQIILLSKISPQALYKATRL